MGYTLVEKILMKNAGVDLLVTTGGMSVDPGDVTRPALLEAGLMDMLYGMPVLPGAMAMVGRMAGPSGDIQVMGVPACALSRPWERARFKIAWPMTQIPPPMRKAQAVSFTMGDFWAFRATYRWYSSLVIFMPSRSFCP